MKWKKFCWKKEDPEGYRKGSNNANKTGPTKITKENSIKNSAENAWGRIQNQGKIKKAFLDLNTGTKMLTLKVIQDWHALRLAKINAKVYTQLKNSGHDEFHGFWF